MEDKRNEQRKQWAANHPEIQATQSMKRRKAGHDYQSRCIYMITLVTKDRKPLFGTLCSKDETHNNYWIRSTSLGEEIKKEWKRIPQYYPQLKLLALQLMPDHMHGVIFVTEPIPRHVGHIINGFKTGCNNACKALDYNLGNIWESGYHDRILSGKNQLDRMFEYLMDNPRRLWVKRKNPDYFTKIDLTMVGNNPVTALGNRFLLKYPSKIQVQCSRSLTKREIAEKGEILLTRALKEDAVLVSPCISPGEKEIMQRAFESRFPQIILLENGISPIQKPGGRQFDACAEGRLLLLSPWEHHDDRRPITREQCLQLNSIASMICQ